MFINWDYYYSLLGVRDFIYFISSPSIQETLFPIKIIFIFFTAFFFCTVIWFYVNSSYIQYTFLQDTTEFLSREKYGLGKVNKTLKKIRKKAQGGTDADLKIAIIDADDFLHKNFQDMGFIANTFEELTELAHKKQPSIDKKSILEAHAVRNEIVYNPNFVVEPERAKRVLDTYENTIKSIATK